METEKQVAACKEFFGKFPSPLKEMAIANIQAKGPAYYYEDNPINSLQSAVFNAFYWGANSLANDFWQTLWDFLVANDGVLKNLEDYQPMVNGPEIHWSTKFDNKTVRIGCQALPKAEFDECIEKLKAFWETGKAKGKSFHLFEEEAYKIYPRKNGIISNGTQISKPAILRLAAAVNNYPALRKDFFVKYGLAF